MGLMRLPSLLFTLLMCLDLVAQVSRSEALYDQAVRQASRQAYDSALASVDQAIEISADQHAYFLRGSIYESIGEEVRAVNDYTEVIRLNARFKEAYFKRGELFYELGVYDQAIEDFSYLVNNPGNDNTQAVFFRMDPSGQEQVKIGTMVTMMSSVYAFRGLTYQEIGEYDKALADLDQAVVLDSSAQNLVNRALLYAETGEEATAIRHLNWAIKLDPLNEIAWFNLVILDGKVTLPDALMNSANFGPMLTYQGIEAYDAGRYGEADRLFRQALRNNPNDPNLLLNIGRLRIKQAQYPEARQQFRRVISMEGSRLEAYYLMGNAFFKEQQFEQAAAYYEQFLVRDRSKPHIWYNTAMAYFELDKRERACEYLKQAMDRGMAGVSGQLASHCSQ